MIHDFVGTDLMDSSDRTYRLVIVILDAEIIRQLQRCFSGRQIEKAAGEINHITIRLAPKAMKSCVNLHAWILVIVKWTSAHTKFFNSKESRTKLLSQRYLRSGSHEKE